MFSTKGRYAIRFMLDLAQQLPNERVPLEDIAGRQDISKKYLEIVVKQLVKAKLVKGASGKGGGYRLMKPPAEITVWDILKASEGSMSSVACLAEDCEPCPRHSICPTLPMWKKYDTMVRSFFTDITLEDLAAGRLGIGDDTDPDETIFSML